MLEKYQQIFKHNLMRLENECARDYLKQRQIDFSMVKSFEMGFASSNLPFSLYTFKDTITISCLNHHGKLVGLFGRKITNEEPKYIISSGYKKEKAIFGLYQAQQSIIEKKYAIITEGIFDVIRMHQIGFTNTVGSPGKDWFFSQIALLRRFTNSVLLMFDNDATGRRVAVKYIKEFKEAGFYVSTVWVGAKDVDDMVREQGSSAIRFLQTEINRKSNQEV